MALPPSSVAPGDDLTLHRLMFALTVSTGLIDAVSFLGMGHVFTANMTGNSVLFGFALGGGAEGVSVPRAAVALLAFLAGAVAGGRFALTFKGQNPRRWVTLILWLETALLLAAAACSMAHLTGADSGVLAIIACTAAAMGLRNATARALAIPDMTTTVLTLTITGIAADSSLAGGTNPRWQRRAGAIAAMIAGAAIGAWLLRHSLTLPLAVCALISGVCAIVARFAGSARA